MSSSVHRRTPPRFVTRTMIGTLATVAFVLSAVLMLITFSMRDYVRQSVIDRLATGQRLVADIEARRLQELKTQAGALADSPTLKAALDTYQAERRTTSPALRVQLVDTVERELQKLAQRVDAAVLLARGLDGEVLTAVGERSMEWVHDYTGDGESADGALIAIPSGVFRTVTVPVTLQGDPIGSLQLALALDARYATDLAELIKGHTLVLAGNRIVTSTLRAAAAQSLEAQSAVLSSGGLIRLDAEEYAFKSLLGDGEARVYVLESVDASANPLIGASVRRMTAIALGGFLLAVVASLWVARTISRPIDRLSKTLSHMTATKGFDQPLTPAGASLEVDSLVAAFNSMMASVKSAEAETLSAYLEAIQALALALDARDPYTAGHSERVSALAVAIGRQMRLDAPTLDVLRLGALLHDIGKIGIGDHLLRKPAPLTADEYEVIKTHPTVGSRILKHVRFLEPHLPIVELHHERPDGRGYPYGLSGAAIPVMARIVHVADAYDAMTSARAYRPALPSSTGLAELQRCAGTDFDPEAVQALKEVIARGEVRTAPAVPITATALAPRTPTKVSADPLDEFASEAQTT